MTQQPEHPAATPTPPPGSDAERIFAGISPEVVYQLESGIFAFEGVTPGGDPVKVAEIAERLRQTFDHVENQGFTNALGFTSTYWRCWISALPFRAMTVDGKISSGRLPLGTPPWKACGALHTQRPKGFGRQPRPKMAEGEPT